MSFYKNINAIRQLNDVREPKLNEVLYLKDKLVKCTEFSMELSTIRFNVNNRICQRCIGCVDRGFNVCCGEDARADHADIVIRPLEECSNDSIEIPFIIPY